MPRKTQSSSRIYDIMLDDPIIVVVAGSRQEYQRWISGNIYPVTSPFDLNLIKGMKISQSFEVGRWHRWANKEVLQKIRAIEQAGRR